MKKQEIFSIRFFARKSRGAKENQTPISVRVTLNSLQHRFIIFSSVSSIIKITSPTSQQNRILSSFLWHLMIADISF